MTDATSERDAARSETIDPNVWSEYDIETHTSLIDRPLRTLKHGDAFAVLDSSGDIGTVQDTAEGLFYRDTRYLSIPVARHGRIVEIKSPLIHQPEPTALTDGFDAIGAAPADEGGTWPARLSRELGSPRGQSELS
jgi:hypothetical protein